jgi:hypothetical protein
MGHERLGALPRSKVWRDIVHEIGAHANGDAQVADIAEATIRNVQKQIGQLRDDDGFAAAFQFIVGLSVAARQPEPSDYSPWDIDLPPEPTTIALGLSLRGWIREHSEGGEHVELATQAATDSLAQWKRRYRDVQIGLYEEGPHPYASWREAGKGGGFSELSHLFFSNFTRRYLNYFLEREASSELNTMRDRERFDDEVAEHASETAKIVQSFAAGWFNKHAAESLPSEKEVREFLDYSLAKIKEELVREGEAQ